MNINFFYAISFLTLMSKKSLGEHVLPEYRQWWFYSDAIDNGLDSCGVSAYSYINLSYNENLNNRNSATHIFFSKNK